MALWHNSTMDRNVTPPTHQRSLSLRDQVDALLPNWQSWYPSLFDAAEDLGILRARVCDLSSLVLSHRHASIYNEAVQAFRNQWSVEEPEQLDHDDENVADEHPEQPHSITNEAEDEP
jgi:hypothetical protein